MNRHVDGRDVHLYDAVNVLARHIGHGHVVSVKEGQARVVVLEVKGVAHTGWKLVDEAENALVSAGVLLVHQRSLKFEPDVVVLALGNDRVVSLTLPLDLDPNPFLGEIESVVENIPYFISVYRDEHVPRLKPGAPTARALFYFCYFDHSLTYLFSKLLLYHIFFDLSNFFAKFCILAEFSVNFRPFSPRSGMTRAESLHQSPQGEGIASAAMYDSSPTKPSHTRNNGYVRSTPSVIYRP